MPHFNPGGDSVNVTHLHQSPFQMQHIFSKHLGIPEHLVRVAAPARWRRLWGMKLNIYSDEIATVVASMILCWPVKFCVRPAGIVRLRRPGARPPHQAPHRREEVGPRSWRWRWTTSARSAHWHPTPLQRRRRHDGDHHNWHALQAPSRAKARTRSVHVNKNLIGIHRGAAALACVATDC